MTMHVSSARAESKPAAVFDHPNASKLEQPTVLTKHQLFSEDHTADVVAIEQVWAAYTFYNDSHNGEGMASIFTEDGVDQHVWNNYGKLVPHYGIVAPGDTTSETFEGAKGSGCVLHGRKQISEYFGSSFQKEPWPWPGHGHHESPSNLVKVNEDGKTAILSTPYVIASVNDKGEGRVATGGYRAFFKKTSEGWEVAELYAIDDHPHVTPKCDVNGPLPQTPKS
jgi:ketosteroid isomerase-like protein